MLALKALGKAKRGKSPLNDTDLGLVIDWLAWYRGSPFAEELCKELKFVSPKNETPIDRSVKETTSSKAATLLASGQPIEAQGEAKPKINKSEVGVNLASASVYEDAKRGKTRFESESEFNIFDVDENDGAGKEGLTADTHMENRTEVGEMLGGLPAVHKVEDDDDMDREDEAIETEDTSRPFQTYDEVIDLGKTGTVGNPVESLLVQTQPRANELAPGIAHKVFVDMPLNPGMPEDKDVRVDSSEAKAWSEEGSDENVACEGKVLELPKSSLLDGFLAILGPSVLLLKLGP
ncbi:hypothetical protein U1Q18_040301 [Sarracenia purpurea var. burkii]